MEVLQGYKDHFLAHIFQCLVLGLHGKVSVAGELQELLL